MVEYSPTVSKYYVDGVVDRLLSENNIIGSAGNLKITSFTIIRSKKSIIFRTSEDDAALCDFTVEFHKIDIPGLYKTIVKYVKGKELFDYLFPGLYTYQPDGPEEQIQQLITLVIDKMQCSYEEAVDIICKSVTSVFNKNLHVEIFDAWRSAETQSITSLAVEINKKYKRGIKFSLMLANLFVKRYNITRMDSGNHILDDEVLQRIYDTDSRDPLFNLFEQDVE